MHRIGIVVVAVMLLSLTAVSSGMAGTRDKCVEKCKEAATFVKTNGIKAAIEEISKRNNRFTWNDGVSYVFLMDMDCKMLAHPVQPELTQSVNLIESKDVNGKPFFMDFIKAAQKGKGWARYDWEVPGQGVVKPKHTFIYRVPGTPYFVGSGFYVMSPGVFY
jgi:signal transduction histidine kinase